MTSTLTVDTIQGSTNADNVKLPKGCVVQVESTTVTTGNTSVGHDHSVNGNNFSGIPGMEVTITPKYATSKILVTYSLTCSSSSGQSVIIRLVRDSTPINVGTDGEAPGVDKKLNASHVYRTGSFNYEYDASNICGTFLDSPATTSPTTYKLQFTGGTDGSYVYVLNLNRTRVNNNYNYSPCLVSGITVMEIAQ